MMQFSLLQQALQQFTSAARAAVPQMPDNNTASATRFMLVSIHTYKWREETIKETRPSPTLWLSD